MLRNKATDLVQNKGPTRTESPNKATVWTPSVGARLQDAKARRKDLVSFAEDAATLLEEKNGADKWGLKTLENKPNFY